MILQASRKWAMLMAEPAGKFGQQAEAAMLAANDEPGPRKSLSVLLINAQAS